MSEDLNRRVTDFSEYEAMDTETLNALLRQDCDSPDDGEPDTERLLYIMEVLAKRREKSNPSGKTTEQAWEIFLENYCPDKELAASGKKQADKRALWLRRVIAAAAAVILIVAVPVTARALSWEEVWDIFARWAKETFSFVSGEQTQITEPDRSSTEEFSSLQDALIKSNRDPSIVPTWIPDGFELDEIEKYITPVQEIYCAYYIDEDKNLTIRIHNHITDDYQKFEINGELIEVYPHQNLEYYLFTNNGQICAFWEKDTYECLITADLSVDELKLMIDSIGKD